MRIKTLTDDMLRVIKAILIYGSTGVGKTVTVLKTLIKPTLFFKFEPRNIGEPIKISEVKKDEIYIYEYVNWEGFMDFLGNPSEEEQTILDRCNSGLLDNVTFLMNNLLMWEIQDETYEALGSEYKHFRPLVDSARAGMDGYGALASKMGRMFNLLIRNFTEKGKPIIATALLQEHPKYNKALAAGPNFAGKMLLNDIPSFFDLIGLVESRYNDNGQLVYPPHVKFAPMHREEDGMFLCKWTGKPDGKKWGILDFSSL